MRWLVGHDARRRPRRGNPDPSNSTAAGRGAYAIRALPDLRFRITSERLGHLDPLDSCGYLESPGTPGAFFSRQKGVYHGTRKASLLLGREADRLK
jgi:hypothetical protein